MKIKIIVPIFMMAMLPLLIVKAQKKGNTRPNIVLFLADDVSKSDFGCYGSTQVHTPNIDALARDGIKFNNAFSVISSCSPSRASLITGRYPHNTGAAELHSPLGEEQIFFPKLLKDAGYYTAQAGKWHIGGESTEPNGPALVAFDRTGGSKKDGGGASGALKWISYLQERPKDKPFFMWFAPHDAHRDFWDQELTDTYTPSEIKVSKFYRNTEATRKDIAGYYNEITRFDHYVGEVIKELKKQNVYDNTIIIIMSDNGRPFPRAKTLLYEDGIMTPLIVHFPSGIKKTGQESNSLVSSIDVAPTLVELAGAKPSPTFQGRSFAKLLTNPGQPFRNYVFAEHNWHANEAYERMVATSDYLLIENKRPNLPVKAGSDSPTGKALITAYKNNSLTPEQQTMFVSPSPEIMLFDRHKDTEQLNNLAGKEKATVKKLLDILHQWQYETSDTTPEYLKPDRSAKKGVDYMSRVEMPGASKNAKMVNKSGPF